MLEPPPREPDELDALLARKRLSGPEYDFIAARVLDQASRPARAKRVALYALPALAAAAVLALAILPGTDDGLRPKGASSTQPALELVCGSGTPGSCPQGELLTFRVEDVRKSGYLHAWAEPAGGGERVWYFEGTRAVPVEARSGPQVLRRAVRIGDQQPPGRYRIRLVLAAAPLDREALLQHTGDALADTTTWLEVIR
jgi:hypothetical protein